MNRRNDVGGIGFTLVELLVVVAILGILMAAVVIAINPVEIMKKGRDSTRLSDMDSLRKAIDLSVADGGTLTATADAGDSTVGTRLVNGTGWVNVNVAQYLSTLPIDPRNGASFPDAAGSTVTGKYLYFSNGDAYELNCYLESATNVGKYATDGGDNAAMYEVGTDPGLDLM